MTKLQIGIAGVLILAGAFGLALRQRTNSERQRTIGTLRGESRGLAALREENQRLGRIATELEGYRDDTAEMARLRDEATALVNRLQTAPKKRPAAGERTATITGATSATDAYVYEVGDLDQKPAAVSQGGRPVYPPELRRAGISGKAVVSFVVGANGEIRDVQGVESTHPEFESAAIEAVKKWKFSAGQKAGVPVNARMQAPIIFNMAPSASSGPGWF